ncbi:MAG: leucyl aminopeptidase [Alphaproteobacteria bacterium]|nr:leucyl aminopeptidase [Alphaproteobacteria bacterium]
MNTQITFSNKPRATSDTQTLFFFEKNKPASNLKLLKPAQKRLLLDTLKNHTDFKGKAGQILVLPLSKDKKPARLIAFGLGKAKDLTKVEAENLGGKLFGVLKANGAKKASLLLDVPAGEELSNETVQAHLAFGIQLKSYNFDHYKAKPKDFSAPPKDVQIVTDTYIDTRTQYQTLEALAGGVYMARDLINEPPNMLHPESYAKRIAEELKPLGVEVDILDEKKMEKLGFGALLAVGQGSERSSKTVIMRWNGLDKSGKDSQTAPIALVGKGVTFDTGGISIKPSAGMDEMKMDMGGSAAVVGTMKALAGAKAKTNVIGIVGLVENMPSHNAYRPGDIITSLSGKTVEVLNTDAEGRLVLADILTYVQDTYKPDIIIDLATLTGAIMVALGFEYAGVFANDNELWHDLEQASNATGEKLWRMPLDAAYRKEMESDVADLKNLGSLGRWGGACSAAGFLEHFIDKSVKWAHIDIAGTAWWKSDKPTTPKGGTGFAVRALFDFITRQKAA